MTETASRTVSVTLNLAPTLEERVVDWLLGREDIDTFTAYTAFSYGTVSGDLSVAEQVSGRRRSVELRLEIDAQALDGLLASLAEAFSGADVRYCVTPILRSGRLRPSES